MKLIFFHIESIKESSIKKDRDICSIDGKSLRGEITKFEKATVYKNIAEHNTKFLHDFL